MKKYFLLFFVTFTTCLFSTITTPWELSLANGYREDHLKWRLQNTGSPSTTTYREKYSNLKLMESVVSLQKIFKDVIFYVEGGYAYFGKDKMRQSGFDLSFTDEPVQFTFNTDAYAAKGNTYLGYVVQLTPDRHYAVNITPLFGFTINYEKIKRKDPCPNPFVGTQVQGYDSFAINSNLSSKDLSQKWHGIFIGINLFAHQGSSRFSFDSGYRYYFLSFKQNFSSDLLIDLFQGDTLSSQQIRQLHAKASRNGNHGHSGYIKLSAFPSKHLKLSLIGNIYYFSSETFPVNVKNQITNILPDFSNISFEEKQNIKNRWITFDILLQLSFYL